MTGRLARGAVVAVLAAVGAVGCSGSSTPTPQDTSQPTSPAATHKPTLPAGDGAPAALRHDWVDVHNAQVQLTFSGRRYIVRITGSSVFARTSFRGHDMWATVQSGGSCPGVGHYRWSFEGSRLQFDRVADACANRASIFKRAFVRL